MLFFSISPVNYQLSGSMTMHSVVHLILHLLEEQSGSGSITIVIDACSVNICQLLIETPLAETNLTDFSQQMLEIVLAYK